MLHRVNSAFSQFFSNSDGNVGFIFGIVALPLFTLIGISLEYSRASAIKAQLQIAVDAAAIAGASRVTEDPDQKQAVAQTYFEANFDTTSFGNITPTVSVSGSTVTVTAGLQVKSHFGSLLKMDSMEINVLAEADGAGIGHLCMLALNTSGQKGLEMGGSSSLEAENCIVHVNSNIQDAIDASGAASGNALAFCSVGGARSGGNLSPDPYTGCKYIPDPFTDLVLPVAGACDHTNLSLGNGEHDITAGVYCGGLQLQSDADVTLAPGVYIIKDGPLTISGAATLVGDGVLFFFTGDDTQLSVKGGANIDIKAPVDGTWQGFAFIQDPLSNPGAISTIQGGGSVEMEGALYTPTWVLNLGGSGELSDNADTWVMVADRFALSGNSTMYVKTNPDNVDMEKVVMAVSPKVQMTK